MSEERPTLDALIEAAKNHTMTLDEEMEQRISWAVGMRSSDSTKTPEEAREIYMTQLLEGRVYSALLEARAENTRLREVAKEAHFLLAWTYQDCITADEMPEGGWTVADLHPSVWNKMNSAEQGLYIKLVKDQEERSSARAALEQE